MNKSFVAGKCDDANTKKGKIQLPFYKSAAFILIVCSSLMYTVSIAQTAFETKLLKQFDSLLTTPDLKRQLYPNGAQTGIMVPSGYGGYGTYLFGFVGGSYPEVYTPDQIDLIVAGGFCVGNPEKFLNFSGGISMVSPGRFTNFSANFTVSRSLGKGTSISAGGLQLFAGDKSDAQIGTYYVAVSHAVQTMPSKSIGASKLTYTVGVGNGRFWFKSPLDVEKGKGEHGTGVFGGISYEVLKNINVNAEWSGMNLGLSLGISPFKNPLSFGIGVANLTTYSADKPTLIFTVGYPLSLNRNKP